MRVVLTTLMMAATPVFACNSEIVEFESWAIEPIDDRNNRITTVFRSHADKPIRMIDASAGYVDALGGEIGRFSLNRDIALEPNGTYEEIKRWGQYTFERLLNLRPEEVTLFTCVRAVLYDDGTKEEF